MSRKRSLADQIAERYTQILERIHQAASRAGRDPNEVRLVVVTKGQPLERIQAVVAAGAEDLGENYPEEAMTKMDHLARFDLRWHMIGHLQRRKARVVIERFDWLHSLDRLRLAQRLENLAAQAGRVLPVLLQFNVSGETTKSGWPAWEESQWEHLLPDMEAVLACAHLQVRGLMTIPPPTPDPEGARPYFRRLRRLREYLARRFPQAVWEELSMGMSADFEVAIEEGATFVRIGTAILGPRPPKAKNNKNSGKIMP